MKVQEIQLWDSSNNLLWEDHNINNLLHNQGEEFILQAAFVGGKVSSIIPDFYYLGLDNRQSVVVDDTMDDLIGEPNGFGYVRAEIASSGDFAINFNNNHYTATSPIVAFVATLGTWSPVRNLFLTAEVDGNEKLISTAVLPSALVLNSGDRVTMRIGMQLKDCPPV